MIEHPQVPFRRKDGKMVTVDEGLEELMVLFRDNGIVTQYSCENNYGETYVVTTMRTGWRFRRMVRKTEFATKFRKGRRSSEIAWFKDRGTYLVWSSLFRLGPKRRGFRTEHTISNHYGFRTTYRWPAQHTSALLNALKGGN